MTTVAPPQEPETQTGLQCPRCGTPYEPNQEYCLECGLRLPAEAAGLVPRLGTGWRRRVGWYPGDWIWPSLLALVVAALAGIGAATFVSHDTRGATYVTRTSPAETLAPATAPEATTPTTAKSRRRSTTTTTPAAPSAPTAANRALKVWPAGESGWTVILQSLPAANGRAFTLAQARAAQRSGLPQVGIIDSAHYTSLHPGYYVLFSGVYTSFDDANTAATTAHSHGYSRAYARRITPG